MVRPWTTLGRRRKALVAGSLTHDSMDRQKPEHSSPCCPPNSRGLLAVPHPNEILDVVCVCLRAHGSGAPRTREVINVLWLRISGAYYKIYEDLSERTKSRAPTGRCS